MFTWTIILSTKEGHTQLTLRGLARALAPRGCDERDARALLLRDAGVDGGRREGWHERLRPAAAMSVMPGHSCSETLALMAGGVRAGTSACAPRLR